MVLKLARLSNKNIFSSFQHDDSLKKAEDILKALKVELGAS
jgi:hypothetical protein